MKQYYSLVLPHKQMSSSIQGHCQFKVIFLWNILKVLFGHICPCLKFGKDIYLSRNFLPHVSAEKTFKYLSQPLKVISDVSYPYFTIFCFTFFEVHPQIYHSGGWGGVLDFLKFLNLFFWSFMIGPLVAEIFHF